MSDDYWKSEVSRELESRVRGLDGSPLSFEQVRGRASRIRRNRRLAAAGTVAAVAAAVVPIAVFAGQGLGGRTERDLPPATSSGDPTQGATEATDGDQASGLGAGYLRERTWVRSDGTTVGLPAVYDAGVLLGDLLVGSVNDDDTGFKTLTLVDGDGQVVDTIPSVTMTPVVNDAGTAMAYVEPDGDLLLRTAEGTTQLASLSQNASVSAVVGACDEESADCRVYVETGDVTAPPQVVDADGTVRDAVQAGPAPIGVQDATESGLLAVTTSVSDSGSCGGLYDEASSRYVLETCEHTLLLLSPDGDAAAVTHDYLDGAGNPYLAILDRSGQELVRLDPPDGYTGTQVWEDDDHLLVTVYGYAGEWSVWRLGTDGTTAQVLDGVRADEFRQPYVLLGAR